MTERPYRLLAALLSFAVLGACAQSPDRAQREGRPRASVPLTLHLDRVPIAVSDFDSAARHFRDNLGFQLERSQDRKDAWDAKFADGSSLQLLPNVDGDGDGGAREVRLRASDWNALTAKLKRSRLKYRESGRNENKKIAILAPSPLERIAFVEESVAAAENSFHANSAGGLAEVWLVVEDLDDTETELRSLGLGRVEDAILQPLRARAVHLVLDDGRLIFVQRDHLEPKALEHLEFGGSRITGVSVGIRDLEGTGRYLRRSGKARHAIARYNEKSCLILAPKNAGGIFLEFVKTP